MDSTTHISELLQKVLRREATADELAELMDWVGTDASGERTKWLSDYLGLSMELVAPGADYNYPYWNTLADKVLQADRPLMNPSPYETTHTAPVIPLQPSRWRRYAVVAAILVLVSAGTWFFIFNHRPAKEMAQTETPSYKNDKAPGGNKAVLTLANGTTITLDTARTGMISQQGNATVIKREDGQLAYSARSRQMAEMLYNTMTTPRGGQYQLTLEDGTKVWLNAASSITFPAAFTGHERRVTITGEAYFEVAHNTAMPFIVKAAGQEVRVLGTHFNINAYPDEKEIKTTLLEGSVTVSHLSGTALLKPGKQASVANSTAAITVQAADVNAAVAWKNGFFSFYHGDVTAIMRQLARWYDVDVKYEGPVTHQDFTGKIDRSLGLAQVLKILEQTKVHFKIEEDKRIVILP